MPCALVFWGVCWAVVMFGGVGRDVVERPYTAGGGGCPPPPLDPPPLPMFEAEGQNFALVPSVPRAFTLQYFRPAFGGDHGGTLGGGGGSHRVLLNN